jgi:hypothetical protein
MCVGGGGAVQLKYNAMEMDVEKGCCVVLTFKYTDGVA